jgi:hypothetical protein
MRASRRSAANALQLSEVRAGTICRLRRFGGTDREAATDAMSNWPYKTHEELRAAGYVHLATRNCLGRKCHARIEVWRTPFNRTMVLNVGDLQPHFATCPDLADFRSGKKKL